MTRLLPTMPCMLTKVAIESFKSIGERIEIELKPITVFIGENATGKSAILQAIAWPAHYLDYEFREYVLGVKRLYQLRNATLGRLPSVELYFSINVSACSQLGDLSLQQIAGILSELEKQYASEVALLRVHAYLKGDSDEIGVEVKIEPTAAEQKELIERLTREVKTLLRDRIFYISALRGYIPTEISRSPKSLAGNYVGPLGEFSLERLAYICTARDPEIRRKCKEAQALLESISGLTNLQIGIEPSRVSEDLYISALYEEGGSLLDLSLASIGQKQVVPIIIQLVLARAGSVLLIEEPEMSLHVKAQVEFTRLVLTKALLEKGVQVVMSTHSAYILFALPDVIEEVRKRYPDMTAEDVVSIYEVRRDENSFTKVVRIPIDEFGYPLDLPSIARVEAELWRRLRQRYSSS